MNFLDFQDTRATKKLRIMIDDIKVDMSDDAEDEDIDNLFGEVCALCDDGGKIMWYVGVRNSFKYCMCYIYGVNVSCAFIQL